MNGISGSLAVSIQTISLMWLQPILHHRELTHQSLLRSFAALYKAHGFLFFYRGFMPLYRSAAIARFGDNASNMFILSHF